MGQIDKEQQKKNLEAAMDVYISTVDGSPCHGTKIHLMKGANGSTADEYQQRRDKLLIFLRGTKKQKKYSNEKTRSCINILKKFGIFEIGTW